MLKIIIPAELKKVTGCALNVVREKINNIS